MSSTASALAAAVDRRHPASAWLASHFELGRGGQAHHVGSMEGLRGFAVFLVFLVHYATLVAPWVAGNAVTEQALDAVHAIGNAGVDLFFVLSGYLIYGSLIDAPTRFARYFRRRVRRIYPAFLVVLTIYVGLSYAMPAQSRIPDGAPAAAVYLLQNLLLLPGLLPIEPVIAVAWSLSYEMFYYLALPLAIWLLQLRARSPLWRVTFFGALAALAFAGFVAAGAGPIRLVMFIAGILVHEAMRRPGRFAPTPRVAFAALVCGLLALAVPAPGASAYAVKIGLLFAAFSILCLACFQRPDSTVARFFSWTPMRWLGNMSYSYYLLHGLALKVVVGALGLLVAPGQPALWVLLMLPPVFALTLVPSGLLFMLVERPASLRPSHA